MSEDPSPKDNEDDGSQDANQTEQNNNKNAITAEAASPPTPKASVSEDAPGAFPESITPKSKRGRKPMIPEDAPVSPEEVDELLAKFDLNEAFASGFRPYRRVAKNEGIFVTIQNSNSIPKKETRIGRYSEELWNRVTDEYEKYASELMSKDDEKKKIGQARISGILRTRLTPPAPIPANIGLDSTTILYYEWARGKGFDGSLGDFLNEVTRSYFRQQGLELAVVVR